jgi:hypothetical protein
MMNHFLEKVSKAKKEMTIARKRREECMTFVS